MEFGVIYDVLLYIAVHLQVKEGMKSDVEDMNVAPTHSEEQNSKIDYPRIQGNGGCCLCTVQYAEQSLSKRGDEMILILTASAIPHHFHDA